MVKATPNLWITDSLSFKKIQAKTIVTIGCAAATGATINIGAFSSPIMKNNTPPTSSSPAAMRICSLLLPGHFSVTPVLFSQSHSTMMLPRLPAIDVRIAIQGDPIYVKTVN